MAYKMSTLDSFHLGFYAFEKPVRLFGYLVSDNSSFGHLGSDNSRIDFNLTKNGIYDPVWNSEVKKIFDFLEKISESRNGTEKFPFDNVGHLYTNMLEVISDL